MEAIWDEVKEFFGHGYIQGSAPLSFNCHMCDLKPSTTKTANGYDGIDIEEAAMSLFSTMGDVSAPECSCHGIVDISNRITEYIKTGANTHPEDYTFHTGKGDVSVEKTCIYSVRDSVQWWSIWHGHGSLEHRWKVIYIAISGLIDDIAVPPQDLRDGTFKFLGHTLSDVLYGLCKEGVHPDEVKYAEMCLLRQAVVQYLEKIDTGLRDFLINKMSLMVLWRVFTGNTHGVAVLHLAAKGEKSNGVNDVAMEMASTCQLTALDMAKEATGVLNGENTETVAGDRARCKQELRWIHTRCLDHFNTQDNAPPLRRYAASGYIFPIMMDRYKERVDSIRFPIIPQVQKVVRAYAARGQKLETLTTPPPQKQPKYAPVQEPISNPVPHLNGLPVDHISVPGQQLDAVTMSEPIAV